MKQKNSALVITFFSIIILGCTTTKKVSSDKTEKSSKNNIVQNLIREGKTEEVKKYFVTDTDINAADENGNTALHLASEINDASLITFFVAKGANTELKNFESATPLHVAIKFDSFEAVRALCDSNADIFARDGDGVTALDLAINKNDVYYEMMINSLTSEKRDSDGNGIVHSFVKSKNIKAILYCIKKQIEIDNKNNEGQTPLALALEDTSSLESAKIAAILISSGAKTIPGEVAYFENAVSANNYSLRLTDGQTPLHLACIKHHNGIAAFLLENNASVSAQDISGATPLHEAVRYGNIEIAKALLDNKANVNSQDSLGKTPILLILPEANREEMYTLLISYGANINHKDTFGDSILHTASMTNLSPEILSLFIKSGADVNIRNKTGTTPIYSSIEQKNKAQISFYAKNGADINAESSNRFTPLTLVLKTDVSLLPYLINSENINSTDSEGNTPLIVAIRENATVDTIKFLLEKGSNINARNKDGNSALYIAVSKGNKTVGELLLSNNADIFSANTKNISPLRLAFTSGNSSEQWIINSKTIFATDGSGNSVLHYASDWQLPDAVKLLLEKGASVNTTNANGETPLFNAAKSNNPVIIELLITGGASKDARDQLGSTPLHAAVRWNALQSAKKLISLGVDVNAQNANGKTPLAESAVEGNLSMAKLLLAYSADPNVYDIAGRTSLSDSIKGKQTQMVKLLLDNNANPQIQDINGRNSYHEAALSEDIEIIKMISDFGGNPLSRDKTGLTPLSLALNKSSEIILAVLGVNKTITDSDGNTPIHIAIKNKANESVVSLLIKNAFPFDTRNALGFTPLSLAVLSKQNDAASILLENGANPFSSIGNKNENILTSILKEKNDLLIGNVVKYSGKKSDIKGNTVLHYAALYGDDATVQRILKLGVNKNVKNISGETPYDLAISWKRNEIANLLKTE